MEARTIHCLKTLNIQHQYGTTRLTLWSIIIFVSIFMTSYIFFNLFHDVQFTDKYFILFLIMLFFLYPIHKILHFIPLYDLRKHIAFRVKIRYGFIPVFHLKLKDPISKNRYIIALLMPFLVISTILIVLIIYFPHYTHYGTLLLASHTSICLLDLLYVKNLIDAPKGAKIEETPKGYEILIPLSFD